MARYLKVLFGLILVGKCSILSSLIPLEAHQGWTCELVETAEPKAAHSSSEQKRILVVLEGALNCFNGDTEAKQLRESGILSIEPEELHFLIPEGTVRYLAIDLPNIVVSNSSKTDLYPTMEQQYYEERVDAGSYLVYELITGKRTNNKWSAALVEILDTPKHYHLFEKEIFIVVDGELAMESGEGHRVMASGETVVIPPGGVHHLKSASETPVRVLCLSFPAFDPTDMHLVE